ncbi:unnamed protein product, partial [marine sediment metagenome]
MGSVSVTNAIEIENLGKKYYYLEQKKRALLGIVGGVKHLKREFWALKDVTFEVPKGVVAGIVGPNGAGKSTLLKIIAGIVRPDTGTVRTSGRVGALLELGIGFHPELNGYENIFLNGSLLGIPREEIKANLHNIIEFSGISEYLEMPVKYYSSGMEVRLGFSIAANINPDIILIDEVFAVGDAEFQQKCFKKIRQLLAAGKTMVLVSHQLPTAMVLCEKLAWLDSGLLLRFGDAHEVGKEYRKSVYKSILKDKLAGGLCVGDEPYGSDSQAAIRVVRVELFDDQGRQIDFATTGEA